MSFDVQRQMKVEVTLAGGLAELRTRGLAAIGRDELCLRAVPEANVREAGTVINLVADYVANQKPVADEERVGMSGDAALLCVRLVREEAATRGLLGMFGNTPGVQRIVDAWDDGAGVPWIALSTILLWRGHDAEEAGEVGEAADLYEASMGLVTPVVGECPDPGAPYNAGGALAALRLAELQPERRAVWLAEACRRSTLAQVEVLGDGVDELAKRHEGRLRAAAHTLIRAWMMGSVDVRTMGPMVMCAGAIAEKGEGLSLRHTLLPVALHEALASTFDTLRDDRVRALAAKVVVQKAPLDLVVELWHVLDLYGRGPSAATGEGWVVGMKQLSLVLAEISTLLVGGADVDDLPAAFGMDAPEGAADRVALARAAFAEFEGKAKAEAMAGFAAPS